MSGDSASRSHSLRLTVLAFPLALCRFAPTAAIPEWASGALNFLTISRTPAELSIVADESAIPESVTAQRGYRAIRVEGPLPLHLIGIFVMIATPLADASIPIFPIATYDTDYVLVPGANLERAIEALERAGHVIREG